MVSVAPCSLAPPHCCAARVLKATLGLSAGRRSNLFWVQPPSALRTRPLPVDPVTQQHLCHVPIILPFSLLDFIPRHHPEGGPIPQRRAMGPFSWHSFSSPCAQLCPSPTLESRRFREPLPSTTLCMSTSRPSSLSPQAKHGFALWELMI